MKRMAWEAAYAGFPTTLIKLFRFFRIRSSDFVDYLETTDRVAARAIVVVRRIDAAIVAEEQVVRVVAVRRGRPIAAVVTDTVQAAIVVVAITRSRIPRCGRR